jgi:hypothetical protein
MPSSPPLTQLDPARLQFPEKPALEGLEAKWASVGRVGRVPVPARRDRSDVFSIDTPPPP